MYHLALDLSSRQRYLLYNNNSWSSEETFSKLSISFLGGWDQPRTVVYWPGDLALDLDSCDVLSLFLYFRALWNPLFYVCRSSRFTPMESSWKSGLVNWSCPLTTMVFLSQNQRTAKMLAKMLILVDSLRGSWTGI